MTNLVLIQKACDAALLDPRAPAPHGGGRRARHFAVWRHNRGLRAALARCYPVVKRLVGGEVFSEMARRYIAAAPPRAPILLCYGETFPDFIDTFAPAQAAPYLGAVARIERARALAYHAADAAPVTAREFSALLPRQFAELRVTLHPSVSMVTSRYPVHSIWTVNRSRAPVRPVSPWAAEAALIARPARRVEVTKLVPGAAAFLQSLARGDTLREALKAALAGAPQFDAAQAMALLIDARIVAGLGRHTRPMAMAH